ncbi:MAG: S9 family peptidase [Ardenticatenaceae bacterium]|nr:S9 family peptidase [Anaerolineales bacterium]MCB8923936.1 S9 family peptidase [Ardenticatenaceae bacterium]MCB8990950.1 S9 family peptidase [Ardenticatenaceae bacterium]MCB9004399.1 S9 family peptidase [Ardenticatenaceae bacterium]
MTAQIAPYGSWKSPITSDLVVAGSTPLGTVCLDGDDIYWLEGRPQEGGRYVVVKYSADGPQIITPEGFNVRTRVHEYGGGSFTVWDGVVYFVNFDDQRLYRQRPSQAPEPVTPESPYRYADGVLTQDGRFICIREDHSNPEEEAANALVSLKLDGEDSGTVLAAGNDFYSTPRLSPDGTQLVWLTWNHPNMPWDGTELWLADLTADGLENARRIAGGANESIFQPEWGPDGTLYFVSDRSNWWNLYRWRNGRTKALHPMSAEFGRPQWVFGMTTYGFADAETIICAFTEDGRWFLGTLNAGNGRFTSLQIPYDTINDIQVGTGFAILNVDAATQPRVIIRLDLKTLTVQTLRTGSDLSIDPGYLTEPKAVEFPTENGRTAYAIYYPPCNKDFVAPEDENPPLLVISHGGPTSASPIQLNYGLQYWTSRGFGVLDVNYGGSTGYGRSYRERLNGEWGIVDVQDCINGAKYLVDQGQADGDRLAIRGGSAGGYTTLCALTFYDVFRAGASYFGVSDAEALARDTHKFESRYLDNLIGPYPEMRDVYVARSPIHFTEQVNCPLILFQGLEDQVVPPSQSESMYAAVKAKGIPVAYVPYEGEQHGFRRAENIKHSLDSELYFYGRIFNFELADQTVPIPIENLA